MRRERAESAALSVSGAGMTLTVVARDVQSALEGLREISGIDPNSLILRIYAQATRRPGSAIPLFGGATDTAPGASEGVSTWDRTTPLVVSGDCWAYVKASDGSDISVSAAAMACASLSREDSWR